MMLQISLWWQIDVYYSCKVAPSSGLWCVPVPSAYFALSRTPHPPAYQAASGDMYMVDGGGSSSFPLWLARSDGLAAWKTAWGMEADKQVLAKDIPLSLWFSQGWNEKLSSQHWGDYQWPGARFNILAKEWGNLEPLSLSHWLPHLNKTMIFLLHLSLPSLTSIQNVGASLHFMFWFWCWSKPEFWVTISWSDLFRYLGWHNFVSKAICNPNPLLFFYEKWLKMTLLQANKKSWISHWKLAKRNVHNHLIKAGDLASQTFVNSPSCSKGLGSKGKLAFQMANLKTISEKPWLF